MRSAKLRPLNRNVERVFDPSMKDKHWGAYQRIRTETA